ncbi:N-6 DNA methylase [Luminiphilus sp.]|nr:N-6 DNA methylase [Luminiphilus sp.]
MDLTGIENEAEFFPAGTLSEVLATELTDITAQWSKLQRDDHPVERIASSADRVLSLLSQLRNTTDRTTRSELHQQIGALVAQSLGYIVKRDAISSAHDDGGVISVINQTFDGDGRCQLWVIDTPVTGSGEEDADPLGIAFADEQFDGDVADDLNDMAIEELIAEGIFEQADAPRYLLIAGTSQWVLVDSRKWPARSVLRFNLQEIFSRQDKDTYRVMACLIAREARVSHAGAPLSDRLEEEAQRNANAVTSSLKKTVRDAIEILGQEVLDVTNGKFPSGDRRGVWIDGQTLSLECLRYMYRMLFLLYAESNPRLGILDIKDPVYANGYSMESLRELESVKLRSRKEKEDTYLWESLQQTLGFLYSGEPHCLKLPAVKVSLLDPESTPLLNSVKLRNEAVQKIIRLLSLRQSKRSTGRISYAKLGIGQLGAVYETLISFTGTVCKEDMIEIKGDAKDRAASAADEDDVDPSDVVIETDATEDDLEFDDDSADVDARVDKVDVLAPTYFVPRRRIAEFNPDAVVFAGTQAKIYAKGLFTYRLAGRDREKTAAYYTPEPLARLLVKHLLMERCKDLSADELLDLKILEPAMGSAAFLVETTNQLADLYLERKQREVGRTIPQEGIVIEKQRVRSYIADRNCFGVDLNPTAVELGAISLWLNGLHKGDFSPWFGDQLHAGNSLIGARRAVYSPSQLKGKTSDLWFNHPPTELGWKEERQEDAVFQWLLPAKDMAAFEKDKSIKSFAGEHQERIKKWRASGFFKPLEAHEIRLVKRLSTAADVLFNIVADELTRTRDAANDEITIWPEQLKAGVKDVDYHKKELLKQRLMGDDHAHNTLPFKRLKTAMDAWCALWLWPIEQADKLPSRQEFFEGMRVLLEGGFSADGSFSLGDMDDFAVPQEDLFSSGNEVRDTTAKYNTSLFQETNVEALIEEYDWLRVAGDVAEQARFVHYDLLFADILKERKGFDLIVGNPPWAKPSWNEGQVLADLDPLYAGLSASEAKKIMADALLRSKKQDGFLREYALTKGAMEVTSSPVMNPFVGGGSNNLYRCFMDLSFRLTAPEGYAALIHQDGHLGDPKANQIRNHWYKRVRKHMHFRNIIKAKMFSEVNHQTDFSLNIYGREMSQVAFDQFTGAFLPSQIEESYADDSGDDQIPANKTADGKWDIRGHAKRIVRIDDDALKTISALSEGDERLYRTTRFLQPFSSQTQQVFEKLSKFPKISESLIDRLGAPTWQMAPHWHETQAQNEGVIRAATGFYSAEGSILQGPMFYVSNPYYKVPRRRCENSKHYDVVDLSVVDPVYTRRCNFSPALPNSEYREKSIRSRWSPSGYHADFYRVIFRRMISLSGERSLTSAIIPPGVFHTHTCESLGCSNLGDLMSVAVLSASLTWDFLVKASSIQDIQVSSFRRMPLVSLPVHAIYRQLKLNCLTSDYADLWSQLITEPQIILWSCDHPCLIKNQSDLLMPEWTLDSPLRTEFSRRMALVENDVIVAQAFGQSLDELIEMYRIYFPVLQENEAGTWYDQNGRIVWTCSKGLAGVGYLNEKGKSPGRKEWESILATNPSELICTAIDDTRPGGPYEVERRFVGPFFTCDRVEDYKRAWAHFEKLENENAA